MKKIRTLLLLALSALLLAAALWAENNCIQTEEFRLSSSRLPAAFDGFRVAVVADLHGKEFGPGGGRLLAAVEAAAPDAVAIVGDLADENTDLSVLVPLAQGLSAVAPTYYVTGNHEWAMDGLPALFSLLEDAGVTVLRNEFLPLTRENQTIVLAGAEDPNGPLDQKTPAELTGEIRAAHGDAYLLMLSHRNDHLTQWSALAVDTVLSGHGHGGILRLPFVGGLVGVDRTLLPDYTAGLYTRGQTTMLVSRGLGNSGPSFRLGNRPHLPVLVLQTMNNP